MEGCEQARSFAQQPATDGPEGDGKLGATVGNDVGREAVKFAHLVEVHAGEVLGPVAFVASNEVADIG